MDSIFQLLCLILLVRGVLTSYSLLYSVLWLKNSKIRGNGTLKRLYILIPVLREQHRIIDTLNYFIKIFPLRVIRIIVITTEREFEKSFSGLSTFRLVKKYIKKNKLEKIIKCIHYPNKYGHVSHQFNFALQTISEGSAFVSFYNADSRPHPSTFFSLVSEHKINKTAKIFQQSSVFLKNFFELEYQPILTRLILQTSAIMQTRWTLAHEIPRFLRQSTKNKYSVFKKYGIAPVVSHGLFIKKLVLDRVGGFPEKGIIEDNFLGFLLRSRDFYIYPLSQLELADIPETIRGLWSQKYTWFWGPMGYIYFLMFVMRNKKQLKIQKVHIPVILTIQGIISALAWLFSGIIVLTTIYLLFYTRSILWIILSFSALFIYGPLQFAIVCYLFPFLQNKAGKNPKKVSLLLTIQIALMSIPTIVFHSIPAWHSLIKETAYQLLKINGRREKTDDYFNNESMLSWNVKHMIRKELFINESEYIEFRNQIRKGIPLAKENAKKHLGILYLPFDLKKKKIYLAFLKNADLWLSPGDYIDNNEALEESVKSVIKRDLHINVQELNDPFMLSVLNIDSPKRTCKKHFDIWFIVPTNKRTFDLNKKKYSNGKWVTFEQARKLTKDTYTLNAINSIQQLDKNNIIDYRSINVPRV